MNKNVLLVPVAAVSLVGLTACGEEAAPTLSTSVTASDIEQYDPTHITRGESAFVRTADPSDAQSLINSIPMVDHIYPNGPQDAKSPLISSTPSRENIQVNLSGKSPNLDNDAACETMRIDGHPSEIGALALGGQAGGVLISWPRQDNAQEFMYVCSFQEMEPGSDQGIVLYTEQ
jgi:hypothetical protein